MSTYLAELSALLKKSTDDLDHMLIDVTAMRGRLESIDHGLKDVHSRLDIVSRAIDDAIKASNER